APPDLHPFPTRRSSDLPSRRHVERFGLEDAVTFTGNISYDEMLRLYGSAEVAVVPSLYEGFSLPAVQAMACGLPLVCTTAGAIRSEEHTSELQSPCNLV